MHYRLTSSPGINTIQKIPCVFYTGHNTGSPLDVEARKHLHLILWEQAAKEYEKSEYAESLEWYNYSLSLFPANEERDKNIAKLQVSRGIHVILSRVVYILHTLPAESMLLLHPIERV